MKSKEDYIADFSSLRHNHQFKKVAPHKAIYYLSLIDCVSAGFISSNKFSFIPQIKSRFLDNWERYIGNEDTYKADVFQPAFYSNSAPFYKLNLFPNKQKKICYSENSFNETYESIELDINLFDYLVEDKTFAAILRVTLISSLT